jgi:hypothetical protein
VGTAPVTATVLKFRHPRRRPAGIVGLFHLMSRAAQQRRIAELVRAGVPQELVVTICRRSLSDVRAAVESEP